jgi:hypothetical protein
VGTIKCLDCERRVSYNADCCPNCGNKRFREQWIALEERWNQEAKELLKQEKQKAKELGYANIEDYRLAKKREKQIIERWEWLVEYSTPLIIGLVIFGYIIWYSYF